jgi:excisionase family DNA binding protein
MSSSLIYSLMLVVTQPNCKTERFLNMNNSEQASSLTLFTVEEAAKQLRVSRWMIYRLMRSNQLKSLTIASRRLIASDDLMDFIKQHKEEFYG